VGILKVSLINAGRTGEGKRDRNHSYQAVFRVIVSSSRDGIGMVGLAIDPNSGIAIPGVYSQYIGYENAFSDPWALCTKVDPVVSSDWQVWIVTCTFETNFQSQQQDNPSDDPTLPWIEIETERRPVTKTWDKFDVKNSSGQLIDGRTKDVSLTSYCFLRNELSCNPWGFYNDCVNSDSVFSKGIGTLKCKIIVDKPQRRNEYVFWPTTYKLKWDPEGWNKDVADTGTAIVNSDGTWGTPKDGDQNPLDCPVFLDGHGQILPIGTAANPTPIVYVSSFSNFNGNLIPQDYQPLPFAALNLSEAFS
jgi:hypothetical protein